MAGGISMLNYANNQNKLWKIESKCSETHIFSTVFDTRANVDFMTIEGAKYSGLLSFDLLVSNSFFVEFSSGSGEVTKPGVVLSWGCRNNVLDSKCCSNIKASGFSKKEINGIYTFTGNFINERHLYVGQNPVYGIWYNGLHGAAAGWMSGLMSDLSAGKLLFGWAKNNENTTCPSFTKVWDEWWNSKWLNSETAITGCQV